jgi:hypothetical protein
MARREVELRKGLSDADFEVLYGTEAQCRAAVFRIRWPHGFECPACGGREHCVLARRDLHQCNTCHMQTSLTAGTIYANTKLPLTTWLRAQFLITQTKQGISSVELGRRLGVKQQTAWMMKSKLVQAMLERDAKKTLDGRVEMDDAYLGGKRSGGKRGRGSPGKRPFVASVETTTDGKPKRVHLRRVKRFTKKVIAKLARETLAPTARVVTDGLGCFRGLAGEAATHTALVAAELGWSEKLPQFRWVNTILGNIKSAIVGTYRAVRSHADRTLAEFEWRFNRRFDLASMIPRLTYAAITAPPMPYRLLKLADSDG